MSYLSIVLEKLSKFFRGILFFGAPIIWVRYKDVIALFAMLILLYLLYCVL